MSESDITGSGSRTADHCETFVVPLMVGAAFWFWPTDEESLKHAPTPQTFHRSTPEREAIVERTQTIKFFHWEVEFPDVSTPKRTGFDAMVGNPRGCDEAEFPRILHRVRSALQNLRQASCSAKAERIVRHGFATGRVVGRHVSGFKALGNWVRKISSSHLNCAARTRQRRK